MKKLKLTEKMIETQILQWLNYQPECYAFKMNVVGIWDPVKKLYRTSSKYVPVGGADIIFCWSGRFGSIEVKTPEGFRKFIRQNTRRDRMQMAFMDTIHMTKGIGIVVTSLDEAIKLLHSNGFSSALNP